MFTGMSSCAYRSTPSPHLPAPGHAATVVVAHHPAEAFHVFDDEVSHPLLVTEETFSKLLLIISIFPPSKTQKQKVKYLGLNLKKKKIIIIIKLLFK